MCACERWLAAVLRWFSQCGGAAPASKAVAARAERKLAFKTAAKDISKFTGQVKAAREAPHVSYVPNDSMPGACCVSASA